MLRVGSIVRLVKPFGMLGAGMPRARGTQRVRRAPWCLAQIVQEAFVRVSLLVMIIIRHSKESPMPRDLEISAHASAIL